MSATSIGNRVKIELRHDALFQFAHAKNRRSTDWPTIEAKLSQLYTRLARPTRTKETTAEFDAMDKPRQDELKDVGGYIPAVLNGTRRVAGAVETRTAIVLDADNLPPDGHLELWQKWQSAFGFNAMIHTTRKHRRHAPRARLVIPADRAMTLDEYRFIAGFAYHALNVVDDCNIFDPTTLQIERFMYWPSASRDQEFWYAVHDAPLLDIAHFLSEDANWRNAEWMKPAEGGKTLNVRGYAIRDQIIKHGGRNEDLALFARKLYQHGHDDEAVAVLVEDHNNPRNYAEPLSEREVRTIIESAQREHARIVAERESKANERAVTSFIMSGSRGGKHKWQSW